MELTENAVRYRAYVAEGESNWDSRTGSSPIRFGFQQTVNATTEPALQQLTDTMNQFDQRIQWVPVISSLWNSQRAAMEADRRTGSGLNAIFQTATFGVDLGTTVFGGGTSRKAIQEGVFSSFEDVGRTFYHGTDGKSALSFLNGGGLDASVAAAKKIDGPEGFFLATKAADAEFFAARRAGGTVLQFNMTERAVRQLSGCGMICQPIAPGKFSNFAGNELIVPPSAFRTFNNLRRAGEITVRPF
ncbi:MAG: hypothetical protein IPJ30_21725 [Acidobacteria bacterium]|nr:hypothetical protein [Acidobacteriota bacterium]